MIVLDRRLLISDSAKWVLIPEWVTLDGPSIVTVLVCAITVLIALENLHGPILSEGVKWPISWY